MHTKASPDGAGDFTDFITYAVKKGINEIGFSEHLLDRPARPMDFMSSYVEGFMNVRRNSPIPIKLGAEVDFFPEEIGRIREFLMKYPFDYVIGSIHFLENWPIDSPRQMQLYSKKNITQIYEEYFQTVQQLCKSKLFDVLGHVDIVKIFGYKPSHDIAHILENTARIIAENNTCVEINTAGLARPCAEIYPSKQFLEILKTLDVPVTLGSDAHKPEDVGRSFSEALKLLRNTGYDSICTFQKRKREKTDIPRQLAQT
jgi:histidinol-phosphatase (PHP family)